jgi:hypothetical protein
MKANSRKKILAVVLCFVWLSAHAQSEWLTVSAGDSNGADIDVVEVDADSISSKSGLRNMDIRVNRSRPRTSWDGVAYRSYTATVAIDCVAKTGRYLSLDFYRLPLWKGTSHKTSTYASTEVRPMQFVDISPNPTERIVKAACQLPSR